MSKSFTLHPLERFEGAKIEKMLVVWAADSGDLIKVIFQSLEVLPKTALF
jgi:hypothetical protein